MNTKTIGESLTAGGKAQVIVLAVSLGGFLFSTAVIVDNGLPTSWIIPAMIISVLVGLILVWQRKLLNQSQSWAVIICLLIEVSAVIDLPGFGWNRFPNWDTFGYWGSILPFASLAGVLIQISFFKEGDGTLKSWLSSWVVWSISMLTNLVLAFATVVSIYLKG